MPKTKPVYFSVIIPARNEQEYIQATIDSVKAQDTTLGYELLVIDNGSIDNTTKVAKRAGARVLHEPISGLPRARECGRLAAKGKYLVYIDADTTMPPYYLSRVAAVLRKHPSVIGVTNPNWFYDGNWSQNCLVFLYFTILYPLQGVMMRLMGSSNQFIGGSFTVNSEILQRAGGFDTELQFFGEDTEISKRVGKYGKIAFMPTVRVATSARRFKINGTFRTTMIYIQNYFSVALFNRATHNELGRQIAKAAFIGSSIILADRLLIRYSHSIVAEAHERTLLLRSTIDQHDVFLLLVITAVVLLAVSALILPGIQLFGTTVNRMDTSEKLIALTFDDGPALATPKVLAILKQHDVPALFFLIGERIKAQPQMARDVIKAGHSVGVHSYRHRWLLPFRSKHFISRDLRATEKEIRSMTPNADYRPRLYRPPHGWRTPWMLQAIADSGYQPILWDIITQDYRQNMPAKRITQKILKRAKPGSIIVLHDGVAENPLARRENMLVALPDIIIGLKKQGFRFVRIQDLL